MKKIVFILSLLFLFSGRLQAQLVPLSLEQRIANSNLVFEGKVIDQSSFWNKEHTHIYTSNLISVYKVFKGELSKSVVEVITIGGIVGNDMERVSYGLELREGFIGVFTCIPNTSNFIGQTKNLRVKAYGEIQGFIRYDLASGTASDVFKVYQNVAKEIYPAIQNVTKSNYKIVNKVDFKIN